MMRRESYSNRFATALTGVDTSRPFIRRAHEFEVPLPRIVGPLQRPRLVELDDLLFLQRNTERRRDASWQAQ